MVLGVDRNVGLLSQPSPQHRPRFDLHRVRGRIEWTVLSAVVQFGSGVADQILVQRAPEGDIEQLHATADRQDGYRPCSGRLQGSQLGIVASGIHVVQLGVVGIAAVPSRVYVAAPADDQSVDTAQHMIEVWHRELAVDSDRCSPSGGDTVEHMAP